MGLLSKLTSCTQMPLLEMLLFNRAHMFKLENAMNNHVGKLIQRHPDFSKRLRHNVAAALLAPNTGAYVVGAHKQMTACAFQFSILQSPLIISFQAHFEKNLNLLGLTAASRQDIVDWSAFTTEVSNELTQQRSNMKSKIEQSIKNQLDIYSLVDNLLIYDIHPKSAHWGRMAFLRECCATWQLQSGGKKGTFWEYVDKELKGV
ncbi:hypothetical protein FIBSPDRAFT_763422 [Athelia psychrophila]|uniref:Uncharacterized protein n=1 Tax=Athelia psychrophila TaxID=1759441 RepID=A0A167XCC8_9AGAM|nr:hypothetical protein FIBSPDRAFT_763422 [Fibularhizoctonia sp. CBS 109695]